MKLDYTLTEEDYINFNLSFAQTSDTVRKSMLRGRIAGPIMFLILPFVLKNVSDIPFAYWMTIFAALALIWFLFLPRLITHNTIKQVRKMLKEKGNNFLGPKTLELRPDGIRTKGIDGETITPYSAVEDVSQYKGGVFIYTGSFSAIMINPGAFHSDQERESFIQEIQSKSRGKKTIPAKKSIFDKLDDL